MHLCELILLEGIDAPLTVGVADVSRYEQPPLILGKPATILIARDLLIEAANPAPTLRAKVTAFACVLSHEIAHHALTHAWRVTFRFVEVSGLPLVDRRKVLGILEAASLAKRTGIPHDVIVNHWGIADETMQSRLVEMAADESDERVIDSPDERTVAQRPTTDEANIQIAEEWGAAVVGCMMFYRMTKGPDYASRMARSALDDLPTRAQSGLVATILLAASANSHAESLATERAIATLKTAFNNPDMQEYGEELRESGRDWISLFPPTEQRG